MMQGIYRLGSGQLVYMMKSRNRKCMILVGMLIHISQLREAEEMQVGQLGTTTDDRGPKDREGN